MDEGIEVFPAIDGRRRASCSRPWSWRGSSSSPPSSPDDTVLDVGCATGYSTAVLARLGRAVIGLEPEPELAEAARGAFARARHRQCGDRRRRRSSAGVRRGALMTSSCSTAACPSRPKRLLGATERRRQARRRARRRRQDRQPGQGLSLRQSGRGGERPAAFRRRAQGRFPGFLPAPCFSF